MYLYELLKKLSWLWKEYFISLEKQINSIEHKWVYIMNKYFASHKILITSLLNIVRSKRISIDIIMTIKGRFQNEIIIIESNKHDIFSDIVILHITLE